MAKTISEQIESLQSENIRLKSLEKSFDKMVKTELGMDIKSLRKIADFYDLKTEEDYHDFLETFCTDEFIEYYSSKENPNSDN